MKTYKEMCASTALLLGCKEDRVDEVWSHVKSYPFTLTASSFVYQVADAMKRVGQQPDMSMAERAGTYL